MTSEWQKFLQKKKKKLFLRKWKALPAYVFFNKSTQLHMTTTMVLATILQSLSCKRLHFCDGISTAMSPGGSAEGRALGLTSTRDPCLAQT